jgi:hypothetical protein
MLMQIKPLRQALRILPASIHAKLLRARRATNPSIDVGNPEEGESARFRTKPKGREEHVEL